MITKLLAIPLREDRPGETVLVTLGDVTVMGMIRVFGFVCCLATFLLVVVAFIAVEVDDCLNGDFVIDDCTGAAAGGLPAVRLVTPDCLGGEITWVTVLKERDAVAAEEGAAALLPGLGARQLEHFSA